MNVRPLHDRLFIHRLDEGEQTIGSIIVPDSAKEKPQRGTVVSVGLGKVKEDGSRQTARREGRRHDSVREVLRPGNQNRRPGVSHHARRRRARNRQQQVGADSTHGKTDRVRRHARQGILRGINQLAERGQGHARPQGPQRHPRQEVRVAHHHQGRRHRRQGNRAEGRAREHGRADGQGSREQDVGRRRRRHHDRYGAGAGDLPRGREERRRRRQPDGSQARHRQAVAAIVDGAQEDVQASDGNDDRAGRDHLCQRRRDHRHDHRRSHGEGRQGRRHHRRRSQDAWTPRSTSSKGCSSIAAISRRTSSPMPSGWRSCSRIRSSSSTRSGSAP